MNTYIDAITYQKAPTGLSLTGQIGNIGRINAASAGANSLTLPTALTSVALSQYDDLYLTDGASSEKLQVGSGGAAIGATTIPLQVVTQYAHVGGTVFVTDGSAGSLGQAIFEASRTLEDICHQALWSTTYTDEVLTMPTMRAAIDNQAGIHFRPRHFPISTLTALSVKTNQLVSTGFDPTQAVIDADQITVDVPLVAALTSTPPPAQGSPWLWPALTRATTAWITITYTAGYAAGSLPPSIQRACVLLTSDVFVQISNPVGAVEITQGKRAVKFANSADLSGQSLLRKNAVDLLGPYITQVF